LALLLIVFFMVEGFAKVVFSLTIRPLPNWGWVLASGIVGILLSFYLLANLTTMAVWLLGVLVGIQLYDIDWRKGIMQIRRLKSSIDGVHYLEPDEAKGLKRLQREQAGAATSSPANAVSNSADSPSTR
jgi:hypothetical protein